MMSCIALDDEPLARAHLEDSIRKTPDLDLKGVFSNAADAWHFLSKHAVDVVFTDIAMPDMDGISLLKSIKNPPLFIFVTANPDYAASSYELDVLDFIVKPFDHGRFLKAVGKVKAFFRQPEGKSNEAFFLTVKDGCYNLILQRDEIVYLKGEKEYTRIVVDDKKEYLIHKNLGKMELLLPKDSFMRVQKSFIVNLHYVRSVGTSEITMKGNIDNIPIGRQYRDELFKRFGLG
ncbi:LytR/AlgR family response regulator transcription factor [Parapedobacter sp. 10938]|uniref:LytR/AlgR family response regulator transcription factor n=1 Tax=Parapedobacter flavus TaxID=3110225 RepID=UPI002DBFB3F3|nr:LytTR family DNA-binding domain-containing protein [Parapedobacter sp. 10938]MEC3880606.1 LytTR family DNA-binding domain-containing protein [Parapedobacter sp. 10938]